MTSWGDLSYAFRPSYFSAQLANPYVGVWAEGAGERIESFLADVPKDMIEQDRLWVWWRLKV